MNKELITVLPMEYHSNFENKLTKMYVSIDDEIKRRAKLAAISSLTCEDLKLKIKLIALVEDSEGIKSEVPIKVTKFSSEAYRKLVSNEKKISNIVNKWKKKNKDLVVESLYLSIGRTSERTYF